MITLNRTLAFDYDEDTDCGYLALTSGEKGSVARTLHFDLEAGQFKAINLDLDSLDRLQGIEFLGAAALVPPDFLLNPTDGEAAYRSLTRRVNYMAVRSFLSRVYTRAGLNGLDLGAAITAELHAMDQSL